MKPLMKLSTHKLRAAIACLEDCMADNPKRIPTISVRLGTVKGKALMLTLSSLEKDRAFPRVYAYEAVTDGSRR